MWQIGIHHHLHGGEKQQIGDIKLQFADCGGLVQARRAWAVCVWHVCCQSLGVSLSMGFMFRRLQSSVAIVANHRELLRMF